MNNPVPPPVRQISDGPWYWISQQIYTNYARAIGCTAFALYHALAAHSQNGCCYPSVKTLARHLGLSRRTVSRNLKRLEKHGLIRRQTGRQKGKVNQYYLLRIEGSSSVLPLKSQMAQEVELECPTPSSRLSQGVGQQSTTNNSNEQDISNKNTARSDSRRTRRSSLQFPLGDYHEVLEAFQRLKGIQLNGEEHKPILQEIKTMFLSERAPEDIISFMEWLAASQEPWTQSWTIRTVRLKLPEFLAGKLGTPEEREDLEATQVIASDGRIFKDIQAVQAAEARGEYYYDFQDKRYHPRRA